MLHLKIDAKNITGVWKQYDAEEIEKHIKVWVIGLNPANQ